jgi:hypothetical protein
MRVASSLSLRAVFLALLACASHSASAAAVLSGPLTSTNGNYSISWSVTCGTGGTFYLYQDTIVVYTGCGTTKAFSNEPNGSHVYHLEKCTTRFGETTCVGGPWGGVYDPFYITIRRDGFGNIQPEPAMVAPTQYGVVPYTTDVSDNGIPQADIPIAALPGVSAETTPRLAIDFDARSSALQKENKWNYDVLGYGWSLSGLSTIRRCEQRITSAPALNFTNTDRLCLDGELLVLKSGTYWADLAEYRTERESFSKIVANGAGLNQSFTVYTEDGLTLRYGQTSASRVMAGGNMWSGTPVINEWALTSVEDQ